MRGSTNLGCLTPIGMLAALLTVLALLGAGFTLGGSMFSPGELNARQGPALGQIQSHAELAAQCERCHTAPWDSTPMASRCLECHTQVQAEIQNPKTMHGGLMKNQEQANCLNCHTEHHGPEAVLTRLDIANFPHEVTGFSLTAHAQLPNGREFECSNCHGKDYRRLDNGVCADCHKRLDKAGMIRHQQVFGTACSNCHDGLDTYGKAYDHNETGFALTGKHASGQEGKPDCLGCHQNQTTIGEARNTPTDCAACHASMDAHQGMMSNDCASCHTTAGWKPSTFDHNTHTSFALFAKHADVKCLNCHTNPNLKTTPTNCSACHGKDDTHGGILGNDCASCHTPRGWKTSTFDHNARTQFALVGKHTGVQCQACHTSPNLKTTPSNCAACHDKDDAHGGKLGNDCASCHTPQGWKPSTFDHNSRTQFALIGKHAGVQCQACHTSPDLKATPSNCAACHQVDDIHQGKLGECVRCHTPLAWKPSTFNHNSITFKLTGKHMDAACASCHQDQLFVGTPANCAACHSKDDLHAGKLPRCEACHTTSGWKPSTFNHNAASFKLTGRHAQAACTDCHQDKTFVGTPSACAACHAKDDAHNGNLGTDCQLCHNTSAWKPSTFDHAKSAFPLTGAHIKAECKTCHANNVFKGTPQNCAACHARDDAHNGNLGTDCKLCHNTNAWKPSTFDHAKSAFPLTGAHTKAECKACHANNVFKGTPSGCAACHQKDDAHQGSLGTDCKACHATSAWRPSTFNHARSAFPLTGAHVNAACTACHANKVFKGTPTKCYDCHASDDHHNGQFGTNCASCHTTDKWSNVTFEHSKTAFPLTGAHASTPCLNCHANGYKGTPTVCSACHKEPTYHAGLFGSDCKACHNTKVWVPASYNGAHTFPINHGDANSCRDCHTSSLSGYTCYTCHKQDEITKKHQEENIPDFSNCMKCHANGKKNDD